MTCFYYGSRSIRISALALIIGLGLTVSAFAQNRTFEVIPENTEYPELNDKTLPELTDLLDSAKLFRVLGSSKQAIDSRARCGRILDDREIASEQYDEFKRQNDARPTAENKADAEYWQDQIDIEIQNYKDCFAVNLTDFEPVTAAGIYGYDAHRNRRNRLNASFGSIANLNGYITDLEFRVENFGKNAGLSSRAADDTVAVLVSAHADVEVLPGTRGDLWRRAAQGYNLRLSDSIRTGPGGRARIVFQDRFGNAGPTVVNLGSNSEVKMTEWSVRLEAPAERQGVIELIRGTIRAFTKNWSFQSSFTVRTGTSICGIRGTELAVSYDPQTDMVDYTLDHGDAYFQLAGGPEVALQPRTAVMISRGQPGAPRSVSDAQWQAYVEDTEPPFGLAADPESAADLSDDTFAEMLINTKASYAAMMTSELLKALQAADPIEVYRYTAGQYHTALDNQQAKSGDLRVYLQTSRQRPLEFKVGCTACKDGSCWTYADIYVLDDPLKEQRVVFVSDEFEGDDRILTSRTWSTDTQSIFADMGEDYCEISP